MKEQERKFSLAEVHTTIGTQGQITIDQQLMDILGVQPGDWMCFSIDEQGDITVKGQQKSTTESRTEAVPADMTSFPHPDQVTQTTLFNIESAE